MAGSPPTNSDRRRRLPLWSGSSKSMKRSPAAGRRVVDGIAARGLSSITLQRYSRLPTGLLSLGACRLKDIPCSAELRAAFSVRVTGLDVGDEVLERVTVVRPLHGAVA